MTVPALSFLQSLANTLHCQSTAAIQSDVSPCTSKLITSTAPASTGRRSDELSSACARADTTPTELPCLSERAGAREHGRAWVSEFKKKKNCARGSDKDKWSRSLWILSYYRKGGLAALPGGSKRTIVELALPASSGVHPSSCNGLQLTAWMCRPRVTGRV